MGERACRHANRHLDLADVVGQVEAKWACEVAAAGRHHMLFHGPPGVGKTMLAERVLGLLPDLRLHDALEVSAVHSLAGVNLADELITRLPYSDLHHSASVASIVGGGQRMARPRRYLMCPQRGRYLTSPHPPAPGYCAAVLDGMLIGVFIVAEKSQA
jgi:magnesium chelatase family protein